MVCSLSLFAIDNSFLFVMTLGVFSESAIDNSFQFVMTLGTFSESVCDDTGNIL